MTGLTSGMLRASLLDDVLDIDLFAAAFVEFGETDSYFGTQLPQDVDLLEQFATDLLLRLLWKGRGFAYGEL